MECNEYHVRLAEPAKANLADIDDYISNELNAPQTAEKLMAIIHTSLSKLSRSPYSYPKARDDRLSTMGYRWLGIKNYMVFFIIDESKKTVFVERILYGRRDWQRIL